MSERGSIAVVSKRFCLTLHIEGPGRVWTESLQDVDSVLIGSGPEAKIRLNDPGVSSLHLLLKSDRGGLFRAIDLDSEAGTRLDGVRLEAPVELASGAELQLASTRIRVQFEYTEPTAPVPQLPLPWERVAAAAKAETEQARPPEPIPLKDFLPPELQPSVTSKVLQVAQMWGDTALSVQQFREGEPVTVGASARNRFQVFSPTTAETFALARAVGTKIQLQVPPDVGLVVSTYGHQRSRGELESQGRLVPSAGKSSIRSLQLGLHEAAGVTLGNVNFAIRFVRPATAVAGSGLDKSEYRFLKVAATCLLAFVALLTRVLLTSPGPRPVEDASSVAQKYIRFLVRPQRRAQAEKKKDSLSAEAEKEKQEAKKEHSEPSRRDPNKRDEDRRRVMRAGLLGALQGRAGASNIFGPGGLGTGVNNALGGLRSGGGVGNAQGLGGLASRGSGPGGGGIGLGTGGLGTKNVGTGGGGSGGDAHGSLDLGSQTKESTRIIPGKTIVVGGLSKDVIARVIRGHQHEIKYCYEVELQKNPSLSGKVAVVFTIDSTGAVTETKVSDTSLHNGATEKCMLARIQRWRFPEPAGGGEVNVTFPWIFKPAGVDVKSQPG